MLQNLDRDNTHAICRKVEGSGALSLQHAQSERHEHTFDFTSLSLHENAQEKVCDS